MASATDQAIQVVGADDEAEEETAGEEYQTMLDETSREELNGLVALTVDGADLFEDSQTDDEEEPVKPEERQLFDCDIFFANGLALSLCGAVALPDEDANEPIKGMDQINQLCERLVDLKLLDYSAATDEGGVLLVFANEDEKVVIAASAWYVGEWEEEDVSEEADD